jgi:hypothetical protein
MQSNSHNSRRQNGLRACGVAAFLILIAAVGCGPSTYMSMDPPLEPADAVTPWAPVAGVYAPTPLPTVTPTPNRPTDESLLTGQPCAPPCWQGLMPGVTSAEEVGVFLENSPYADDWEREERAGNSTLYLWNWAPPSDAPFPNQMLVRDKVLAYITLWPDTLLMVGQVTLVFGVPEKVDLVPPEVTGTLTWTLELYYPQNGLRMVVSGLEPAEGETELCIETWQPVYTVTYLPAGDLNDALQVLYPSQTERDLVFERLRTWDGVSCLPTE